MRGCEMRKVEVGSKAYGIGAVIFAMLAMAANAKAPQAAASVDEQIASSKAVKAQLDLLNYPGYPQSMVQAFTHRGTKKVGPVDLKTADAKREWGLSSIGFFDVLSQLVRNVEAKTCAAPIVVAIVDTGVDYTHPELMDALWMNPGETGPWEPSAEQKAKGFAWNCRDKSCNGLDDDGNGYADDVVGWDFVHDVPLPFDTHGHGTHIAGIIHGSSGARVQEKCPRVALMPLKYYDSGSAGFNNLTNTVRAIEYAIRNGAHIINYSGGGADPAVTERRAVAEANRKGILFVAASGNDGRSNDRHPYYPASYPLDNIISVASVNKLERLLPSSNYGKSVHVAAPGLMILSTLPSGRFGTMSGTSQATAFVTGAAALIAAEAGGAEAFDYHTVKTGILEGARPLKANPQKTLLSAGLLSIPGSLKAMRSTLAAGGKRSAPTPSAAIAAAPPTSFPKNGSAQ